MKNQRNAPTRPFAPSKPSTLRAVVESLEDRRLLAAVTGIVYGDGDNNALRGFFEDGVADQTLFLDANQNGQFDDGERTTTTDAQGRYRFGGLAQGDHYVGLLNPDGLGQSSPGLAGRVPTGFNIDVVFPDNSLTAAQQDAFETAAQKWESILLSDLPDVVLSDGTVVDDLRISATGNDIDGPFNTLAQATFTDKRSPAEGGLPYLGFMQFDTADLSTLENRGTLDETVLHEMGHVLGIGTLWFGDRANEQLVTGITGQPNDNPFYVGENAVREGNRLLGSNTDVVAIEPGGRPGSSYSHWAESVWGTELMTPFTDPQQPLSRLTVGGLQDLGYEVNYLNVDEYNGIGPLDTDLTTSFESTNRIPFEIGLTLKSDEDVFRQANFGVRANAKPSPFFFQAGPTAQTPGGTLSLLSTINTADDSRFTGDTDFRDSVVQMNFYRETNGQEGLQTGEGGDELLSEQPGSTGTYAYDVDTGDFAVGTTERFYSRAFDSLYFTRDTLVDVNIVGDQTVPARPTTLQAVGTSTGDILVNFADNSTDETGFLLEVSSDANFDTPGSTRRIYLPAGEGTGPVTYDFKTLDGPVTERSFRVRAYNTAGSTPFSDRATARTLSQGEILVDNDTAGAVTTEGFTRVSAPLAANVVGGTYLSGTSGFADFDPMLGTSGRYFVFVRSVDVGTAGTAAVSIFGAGGNLLDTIDVDQAASAAGDVLLGSFTLGAGSYVRVAQQSGTATADTVRLLPVG